ncbi:unnamed protein product [Angiostrongylus costaricensis]|uniref:Uncharacterized protein n=1 Tax=Angiostrongylus costaricensis TaxID=334426 RepID=A0A3P7H8G9_ANGCS|nr:unnamed protein product [Angiostrongylus costaricensis]
MHTKCEAEAKNSQRKAIIDVSIPFVREKCLAAFELAFDKGNDKAAHYAVEGVQVLLRDTRFHSTSIESPNHSLPTQVLSSVTGVAQWNSQLQCHCLTLLVEMVCSTELRVSLQEVEECLELYMRVFGSTRDESARVSARAAVSQSITGYCSNRYSAAVDCTPFQEESQNALSVYMDVTKLLESYVAKLEQLTASSDHSVVLFDAVNALLTAQPLSVVKHTPFVNLLWEKLCPLMIRLFGVPDKNVTNATISSETPLGQGQMAKFTLSPAVVANPEATRLMYQILDQLVRIMAGIPSVYPVLEALFHKAFLFPKIEQRTEAIRIIKKMLSERRRVGDIVSSCVRSRSLSLWRMLLVCMAECAQPQHEVSIEAVRACGSMVSQWSSTSVFENSRETNRYCTKYLKPISENDVTSVTSDNDESTEKITARKFVDSLMDRIAEWSKFKSTLEVDDAILEFSSGFYNVFSAMQNEAFKLKSKAQLEFLNTDAIYITVYSTLCLALRGKEVVPWVGAFYRFSSQLADRCGWIFEKLVESSCDVDELRTFAESEDQKRVRVLNREDLLSMQLVLDSAFVSIHAPECWKHVIRCSEYIWELEKFIYGALCYEKPSRFSFSRNKQPAQPSLHEEIQVNV